MVVDETSVFPEVFEPACSKLRIPHSMLNVLMAQVVLYWSSVVAVVGQLVAGTVPKHVGMYRESDLCTLAGPG